MPTRNRPPAHLPASVRDHPAVIAACRERDLGRLFRTINNLTDYPEKFTASHIARRCEMTQSQVGDYMADQRHASSLTVFNRVADGLHISATRFGLTARSWEHAAPRQATTTPAADQRTAAPTPAPTAQAAITLPASLSSPITANTPPGSRIAREVIDQLRERAVRMRRLDDFLGGADTFRLYSVELAETERLIRESTYSESVEKELRSIAAEQAQQAGWAAFDAGDYETARKLYESSRSSAQLAGDKALIGNALSMLSYQLISTSRSGVEAASASCEWTRDSSNAVRALMLERRAFAYANAGDERQTEIALSEAEDALYGSADRQEPHWVSWADRKEFQLIYGRCWAELHRPLRAVPILESVLAEFDDSQARNKSVYLTWLASAYIDGSEIEQAVTTLGRALDLSVGIASVRPAQRATLLAQRLIPHRQLSAVTDLLDRVGDLSTGLPSSP